MIISARYAPPSVYPPSVPGVEPPVLVLATDDIGTVRGIAMDDPNEDWQAYLANGGTIAPDSGPISPPPAMTSLVVGPTLAKVFGT